MPQPARPTVEVLETRDVPAFGLDATFAAGGITLDPVGIVRVDSTAGAAAGPNGTTVVGNLPGPSDAGPSELVVARAAAAGAGPAFGGGDGPASDTVALPGAVAPRLGTGPAVTVVNKAPTAVEVTPSARILTPGRAVTLTAAVRTTVGSAAPAGAVEFRAGARVLGTAPVDGRGQARVTTDALGAGAHAVTAVYAGSGTCEGSISPPVTLTTGRPAATTTTLTAAVAAPVSGQAQALTARVTGATAGRVDFFDGPARVGSAAVDATGTATLSVRPDLGGRRYRAVFAGTREADGSASAWVFQTVGKAPAAVAAEYGGGGLLGGTSDPLTTGG